MKEHLPIRVLYILGYERSGSTFLQNLIAIHPEILPVGEVHHLWDRGLEGDVQCGCGMKTLDCPVWARVFRAWLGDESLWNLPHLEPEAMRIRKWRKLWVALSRITFFRKRIRPRIKPYLLAVARLYQALKKEHPEISWILDSSKTPIYAQVLHILEQMGILELRYLHIVRSPYDTEASVWKRKLSHHPWYRHYWPGRAAARWAFWTWVNHHWFHKHPEYRLLAYDTLLQRPRDVVHAVHRWLGVPPYLEAFASQRVVFLDPAHTFGGSPSRFRTGRVVVAPNPNPPLHPLHRVWASILAIPGTRIYREALAQKWIREDST